MPSAALPYRGRTITSRFCWTGTNRHDSITLTPRAVLDLVREKLRRVPQGDRWIYRVGGKAYHFCRIEAYHNEDWKSAKCNVHLDESTVEALSVA